MSTKIKNKVITIGMLVFFLSLSLMCLLKPASVFSDSERRYLEPFPEISAERIFSGEFMQDFEAYTLDQFPFREKFRNIKALFASYGMRQGDNNGIYVSDGSVSQMEYPLKKECVERAGERFGYIYDKYLAGTDSRVYVSVIPDKNYFMAEKSGHLSLDYTELVQTLLYKMEFADYVDITGLLSLEDYYKTDTHWRQECITDVADTLLTAMGGSFSGAYEEKELDRDFYGVYFGQAALPLPAEKIKYLTSEELSECTVYDFEDNKERGIYDFEKGQGKDAYELFLSGSRSLLTIENPNAASEKELILFRDSFGSSLAPLLTEGYKKITLVDIRYIHPDLLERFIEFENQDVLFLYSTLVLNNAEILK